VERGFAATAGVIVVDARTIRLCRRSCVAECDGSRWTPNPQLPRIMPWRRHAAWAIDRNLVRAAVGVAVPLTISGRPSASATAVDGNGLAAAVVQWVAIVLCRVVTVTLAS
jgi:hypothetical protein